jgi:hypothetical protein
MLKSAVFYVILVGVPLAGLFAILGLGRSLEPPAHVGGAWTIEPAEPDECAALPAATVLSIEQSGRFLRVRLPHRPPAKGRFEGDRLQARVSATSGACAGLELDVDAHLDADGESMLGTVAAPACTACPSSAFVARREKAEY